MELVPVSGSDRPAAKGDYVVRLCKEPLEEWGGDEWRRTAWRDHLAKMQTEGQEDLEERGFLFLLLALLGIRKEGPMTELELNDMLGPKLGIQLSDKHHPTLGDIPKLLDKFVHQRYLTRETTAASVAATEERPETLYGVGVKAMAELGAGDITELASSIDSLDSGHS